MVIYIFLRTSYSQSWRKDKGAIMISVLLPIDNFFCSFLFDTHRYAHLTFGLRGVGCRPPLLL